MGTGDGTTLAPDQFALVVDAIYFSNSTTYEVVPEDADFLTIVDKVFGRSGWSNSIDETVVISDAAGRVIDILIYSPNGRSGFSWEWSSSPETLTWGPRIVAGETLRVRPTAVSC